MQNNLNTSYTGTVIFIIPITIVIINYLKYTFYLFQIVTHFRIYHKTYSGE